VIHQQMKMPPMATMLMMMIVMMMKPKFSSKDFLPKMEN
jgi:hypothetical protein